MTNVNNANAYSEVLQVLKHISIEDYNKIPKNKMEFFIANANTDNEFIFDPSKTLNQQNVSKRAKAILAILFRDYWATPEQKKRIIAKQKQDIQRIEEAKGHYEQNELFKNKDITEKNEIQANEKKVNTINSNKEKEELPIEVKKENILDKIKKFFRRIFHNKYSNK